MKIWPKFKENVTENLMKNWKKIQPKIRQNWTKIWVMNGCMTIDREIIRQWYANDMQMRRPRGNCYWHASKPNPTQVCWNFQAKPARHGWRLHLIMQNSNRLCKWAAWAAPDRPHLHSMPNQSIKHSISFRIRIDFHWISLDFHWINPAAIRGHFIWHFPFSVLLFILGPRGWGGEGGGASKKISKSQIFRENHKVKHSAAVNRPSAMITCHRESHPRERPTIPQWLPPNAFHRPAVTAADLCKWVSDVTVQPPPPPPTPPPGGRGGVDWWRPALPQP